jgi:hypothetical protein
MESLLPLMPIACPDRRGQPPITDFPEAILSDTQSRSSLGVMLETGSELLHLRNRVLQRRTVTNHFPSVPAERTDGDTYP